MIEIPHNSPLLHFAGRWETFTDCKGSGWQGAQIRFKVTGTLNLTLKARVLDSNSSDVAYAAINVDSGPTQFVWFSTASGTANGVVTSNLALPNTNDHTIIIKLVGVPTSQWASTSYARLMSVSVDDTGQVLSWGNSGPIKLGIVGDSWMASENDWPFLMGFSKYSIYPTSFGGASASTLDAQYNYDRSGVLNTSDPSLTAILVNSSVNDYAAGVSLTSFQSSFTSLLNKIRAKHPEAKIIVLQSPRNVAASMNYDQYGPALQAATATISNAVYIPIPSTAWNLFAWDSDTYHLSYAGRKSFAEYVDAAITPYLPVQYDTLVNLATPQGVINIPAIKKTDNLSTAQPAVRLPDGFYELIGSLISSGGTQKGLLIRTKFGLFKYGLE